MGPGPLPQRTPGNVLALVVALPVEGRTLHTGHLQVGQTLSLGPDILLHISGMGSHRAVTAATALRDRGARAILSWGCSAALIPELTPGDLLLPETFVTPDGESVTPDQDWWIKLIRCLEAVICPVTQPLVGTDEILATSEDKLRLHRRTGAAAADMETAFLARWAKHHAMPFVAIRSISDCAGTSLPAAIQKGVDSHGGIDILALCQHLLRHPGQIPPLIRLGRQFRCAHNRLLQVAETIRPHGFCLPC